MSQETARLNPFQREAPKEPEEKGAGIDVAETPARWEKKKKVREKTNHVSQRKLEHCAPTHGRKSA